MMHRLKVSGYCQVSGMCQALGAFLPGWEVTYLGYPNEDPASVESFVNELRTAEAWASADTFGKFEEIAALAPHVRALRWPQVVFPAFHPDIVLVWQDGKQLEVGRHVYHSAIVLWAFLNGLSAASVVKLFDQQVFQRLGYLDQWAPAVEALKRQFDACGLDFQRHYRPVKRAGVFMHSHDHAKIVSILHVARQVAEKVGGVDPPYVETAAQILDDALMYDAIWPVYPEIASRYGLVGSYAWRLKNIFYTSLESYVERAYADYAEVGSTPEDVLRTSDEK